MQSVYVDVTFDGSDDCILNIRYCVHLILSPILRDMLLLPYSQARALSTGALCRRTQYQIRDPGCFYVHEEALSNTTVHLESDLYESSLY